MNITAIILNRNEGVYLHKAVHSAINQISKFDEILIIDDASTDDSVEIVNKLIDDWPHCKLIRFKKQKGVNEAILYAFCQARSEYVFLMSASNEYSVELVSEFKKLYQQVPNALMFSGRVKTTDREAREKIHRLPFAQGVVELTPENVKATLKQSCFSFFGGGNILHRQTVLSKHLFKKEMKWHADWYMYLMLSLTGKTAVTSKIFSIHSFKENRYSSGMFDRKLQRNVTAFFIENLLTEHPKNYEALRKAAVLPVYSMDALYQILNSERLRPYLTWRLCFLCLSWWPMKNMSKYVPTRLHTILRRFLSV